MSKPPLGLLTRIRTQIEKDQLEPIAAELKKAQPYDAAWCVSRLPVEDRVRIFTSLDPLQGARIFQEMDLTRQTEILNLGRLPGMVKLVQHMDSDEMADVLGSLDPIEKVRWLSTLPQQELSEAESLLAYPPDTAGGMMAKEFLSVPATLTVGEVASRLQKLASNYENVRVSYVYVVEEAGKLEGVLPLRNLILTPKETPVREFMLKDVATIADTASKREVAELFRERNLLALPVVNSDRRLVGVITSDDVMDVIQELADEELLKLAGVSREESRESPLWKIVHRRLSWLTVNIFLNLAAASVIAFYEDTLSAVIALAFFLPIISDMSGCSGMQAVAVSVRDLALQKLLPADYFRVLQKELMIGLINGLVLGTIIGIVAFLLKGVAMLGVVVALALWINTVIAVSFGGVVPLLIKRFKFDPAIASGPVLTTLTDIMGFFILLSLATLWLPLLTHGRGS